MANQDQNAALLNQLGKQGEEMFHGSTIRELTVLVDDVMRTHEINAKHRHSGKIACAMSHLLRSRNPDVELLWGTVAATNMAF